MSHTPASPPTTGDLTPSEIARTIGQVEFLAGEFLDQLAKLAPHDPNAKDALGRLKKKLCEPCV